jgi:hypothetical protein
MEKITGIHNYGNVHKYEIKAKPDLQGIFCRLFSDLGFGEEGVEAVDTTLDHISNDYLYVEGKGIEAHFFITEEYINLVLKTKMAQEKLNAIIAKHFELPK